MEKPLIQSRLYTMRAADAMDPQSELSTVRDCFSRACQENKIGVSMGASSQWNLAERTPKPTSQHGKDLISGRVGFSLFVTGRVGRDGQPFLGMNPKWPFLRMAGEWNMADSMPGTPSDTRRVSMPAVAQRVSRTSSFWVCQGKELFGDTTLRRDDSCCRSAIRVHVIFAR